jgi:hypothetical protein
MSNSYMIAVLDVLGFSDIIRERDLNTVLGAYNNLIALKRYSSEIPVLSSSGIIREQISNTIFSDTILLWVPDDDGLIYSFTIACAKLICEAFDQKWYLRGAIAFGPAVMDLEQRVFIGLPIIAAHLAEISQEWIGIGIHNTARDRYRSMKGGPPTDIVSYQVPVKQKNSPIEAALNWPIFAYSNVKSELRRLAIESPAHKGKYDNTINFIELFGSDSFANK